MQLKDMSDDMAVAVRWGGKQQQPQGGCLAGCMCEVVQHAASHNDGASSLYFAVWEVLHLCQAALHGCGHCRCRR